MTKIAEREGRPHRQNTKLDSIPLCPIFEPTLEEFENISFSDYVTQAESMIPSEIGCFKVSY